MNFLIVGSAGGLGSYLFRKLKDSSHCVYGIDVIKDPHVDFILPNSSDTNSYFELLSVLFSQTRSPWTVVITIANKGRSRLSSNYEFTSEDISSILSLNSHLLTLTAKALSATSNDFVEQSHIINIGSFLSQFYTSKESPIYGASKAAAKSLVRDLSIIALKDNICVNSISPSLLFRNQASLDFLNKYLSFYSENIQPTAYIDIFKLIEFISLSGVKSLRGKDLVLDYGLEDLESFEIMSTVAGKK